MRKSKTRIPCLGFILAATILTVGAETPSAPGFEDILKLKTPGSVLVSPDGRYVVFTVSEADFEENTYRTQMMLADTAGGTVRQLTWHKKSSSRPSWSPDGKMLAFISSRKEKPQIHLLPVDGGEARRLTDAPDGVGGFIWCPDGTKIAYTATDDTSKEEEKIEDKFGRFEVVDGRFKRNRLWIIDTSGGKAEKILERDDLHIGSMDWSPDGTRIAFAAVPDPRAESWSKSDIYVLTLADRSVRRLVGLKGSDGSPVWSSCGRHIAFSSSMDSETWFHNSHICRIPAGGGDIIDLTPEFDENASPMYWKPEGIYFSAYERGARHLFRLNAETRAVTRLTGGEGFMLRGVSLTADGSRMAFSYTDADRYPEVYISNTANYTPKKLTDFSVQLSGWTLGSKEMIRWKSKDGAEVSGVLMKPADFDPARKYPLLVIIHGGPTGISYPQKVDSRNSTYPIEQWLARGAVILQPNYRGSAGFGQAFRSLNYRNLGVGDAWDVLSGVDYLVKQGFVDNERLGCMGWSQGGYISAFLTTTSDRFQAISVGAGISDWVTYYVNTDIHPFTRVYLGADPWEDEEVYRKTSPMSFIRNARTPTLIQHGEFDRRVPIPNAYKLYQGLRDMGVPVKFIVYKGFGHGVTKPREKLAVLTHNWEWFDKYIWPESFIKNVAISRK